MKTYAIYLALLIFLLTVGTSCTNDKDLKAHAERLRVKHNIPAMAVAVVKADTILEMFTLGKRRAGHPDTVTINDKFHIGSNTKSFTAFAAAQLVEQGKIAWSTTFGELFPEWEG
ncbi:MAG: serine hydrolase, partial [Bacteroidota bacterium]